MNAQESTMPPQLHSNLSRGRSRSSQGRRVSASSLSLKSFRARVGLGSLARRTLGIALLLVTVFLWTTSNFLASVELIWPLHSSIWTDRQIVYFCGQHLLKAVFRHIYKHFFLCLLAPAYPHSYFSRARNRSPEKVGSRVLEK